MTRSYLWAAPLLALLLITLAGDIPMPSFLGLVLLIRVLTDASQSSKTVRHSGSLNLSSAIAILFILVCAGLLARRRERVWPVAAAIIFLGLWTVIALRTHGASAETFREGVREASVIAIAVIVCNSCRALTIATTTRIVQGLAFLPAMLALYQLATHTGLQIEGQLRAYGTFNHPDGAAMFFALATLASLWRYVDNGRRRLDLLSVLLFAAATIATFSLTGIASLLSMLLAFGALRPGSFRLKLGSYAVAALVAVAFLVTPLGAARIANESSRSSDTSLAWRLYKWGTLIPEWERSPFFGQGLGATITAQGTARNTSAGLVPHNEYLRYLVETGAIGLLTLLGAIAVVISRLINRARPLWTPGASALGVAIVVGCLVDSLTDNTLLYTTTGYVLALILAAVLSSPQAPRYRRKLPNAGYEQGRREPFPAYELEKTLSAAEPG